MRALPVFDGFTVDGRLREFRKVDRERGMVFVPFDSPEGERLLARWREARGEE
jgi:hypothetical protein